MTSKRKNTLIFKFKEPGIEGLKILSSKLTTIKHNDFIKDHREILNLLVEKGDPFCRRQFSPIL